MFIAMNRFEVVKGKEDAFERMWKSRDSYLHELRASSNSICSRARKPRTTRSIPRTRCGRARRDFEAWTKSEEFRRAHARAGNDGNAAPLYLEHPKFEGFEVRQTLASPRQGRLMQVTARSPIWRACWPPLRAP